MYVCTRVLNVSFCIKGADGKTKFPSAGSLDHMDLSPLTPLDCWHAELGPRPYERKEGDPPEKEVCSWDGGRSGGKQRESKRHMRILHDIYTREYDSNAYMMHL